jgi:hypothetical protein
MHMMGKLSSLKTVRISDETHKKILRCGKMGDSLDNVITRIVNYYIDHEMGRENKTKSE